MAKFKEIPISRYVLTEFENVAANYDITDEQGDALLELLEEAAIVFPEDKGPGYANPDNHGNEAYFGTEKYPYTEAQLDALMGIIAEACDIMDWSFTMINSERPQHAGDVVLVVRDSEGAIVLSYDGDVVKALGEVEEETTDEILTSSGIVTDLGDDEDEDILTGSLRNSIKARIPWLFITLLKYFIYCFFVTDFA